MFGPEEKPYLSVNIIQSQCFWAVRNRTQTRTRSRGWSETDNKQEEIKLHVRDPMTHVKNQKAVFTDYRIEIKVQEEYIIEADGFRGLLDILGIWRVFPLKCTLHEDWRNVGSTLALNYSSVRRRYSEFVWLDNQLRTLPEANVPFLPEKKVFGRFAVDFIKSRQRGLEDYLRRVIEDQMLLSNAHLHFFLQTNFTPSEIESTLSRKDHEDVNHIIILATANQDGEHLQGYGRHRSISDSALESSYSSLDIYDLTSGNREVFSSGYYGDDEVPNNDQSENVSELRVAQSMLNTEPVFSSSSESELSFEEFFEFDDKADKKSKSKRKSQQSSKAKELFEYLVPMSECKSETYVVFGHRRREKIRPRKETNTERIKKLINEYEVVSIL